MVHNRSLEAKGNLEHLRGTSCTATSQEGRDPFLMTAGNFPLKVSQYSLSSPNQRVPCLLTAVDYRFDTVWLPVYTTGNQRAAATVATGRHCRESPLHRCLLPRTCSQHADFILHRRRVKEECQPR
jgi:hypothetical protein